MDFLSLLVLSLGLSMDSFAVSLSEGVRCNPFTWTHSLKAAFLLAFFQAMMPFLGWVLGSTFQQYIERYDHWIAFGLLLIVGGQMLIEGIKDFKKRECIADNGTEAHSGKGSSNRILLLLALATSIDALAVGISFACLQVNLTMALIIIFVVTFLCSMAGQGIGYAFGCRMKPWAGMCGGIILVLIGLKILLEHLSVI